MENFPEKKTNKGRKPIKDNKKRVILYVKTSIIDEHGGDENLKENCYKYLGQNN